MELDSITGRLELLDRLKKKYGGSIEAVLEAKARFDETTKRFENADEHRAALQRSRDEAVGRAARCFGEIDEAAARSGEDVRKENLERACGACHAVGAIRDRL